MYQQFIAPLQCRHCDGTTDSTDSELQTAILTRGLEPPPLYLRVGDRFPLIRLGPQSAGYLRAKPPEGEKVRFLLMWECPLCDRTDLWAEVVLRVTGEASDPQAEISEIQSVSLPESLARAHFLSFEFAQLFRDTTGHDLCIDEQVRPNFADLFLEHRAAAKGERAE